MQEIIKRLLRERQDMILDDMLPKWLQEHKSKLVLNTEKDFGSYGVCNQYMLFRRKNFKIAAQKSDERSSKRIINENKQNIDILLCQTPLQYSNTLIYIRIQTLFIVIYLRILTLSVPIVRFLSINNSGTPLK